VPSWARKERSRAGGWVGGRGRVKVHSGCENAISPSEKELQEIETGRTYKKDGDQEERGREEGGRETHVGHVRFDLCVLKSFLNEGDQRSRWYLLGRRKHGCGGMISCKLT
jgi:hypothetical protein